MQRQLKLGALSAVAVGLWSASYAHAAETQRGNGLDPEPPTPTLAPGTWQIGTSNTITGLQYKLWAEAADVPALLQALGAASHTRIIVSDDVHARLSSFRTTGEPIDQLIKLIAAAAHLIVGKVGADTFLIVNAPSTAERVPLLTSPFSTPFAPYVPRVEPLPMPGSRAKLAPRPNWSPRTFNGMTYYMIPLTQSATATTPALQSPKTPAPRASHPGAITPAHH